MISTWIHGILDYTLGMALVMSPWMLGVPHEGPEIWIPVVCGSLLILSSLFTRYEGGIVRRIPMSTHLIFDGIGGGFLALSPWVLGFADQVWAPHLGVGSAILLIALFTRRRPRRNESGRD